MKFQTEGIGTKWWIEVFDENLNQYIFTEIENKIKEFEGLYSRFLNTSLVYKLNKEKTLSDFPSELYDILKYCQSISELTDYRFNVCSGTIQESHGYDENYSFQEKKLPDLNSIKSGLVRLDKEKIQIKKEVVIDIGGVGKGWLIDSMRTVLEKRGYKFFCINGGGDVYVTSNLGQPIRFLLENPFNMEQQVGFIDLKDAAFACSSPSRRSWITHQGHKFHHLVNSNEGESSELYKAVFTYGKSGLAVDTASTCIFISPYNNTEFLAETFEVEYLGILPNGGVMKSEKFPGELN